MSLFLRFAFVILLGASVAGCPQEPVGSDNFDVNVQTTGQGQVTGSGDLTVAAIYGTNVLELSDATLWEISLGFVASWRVGDPVVLDGVRLTNTYGGTISVAARGDVTYRGTVGQVQAAGEILVLDDDSQWRIHVADRAMVALWSAGQAVVMGQTDVVSFHVVRTSDGQIAAAAPAN